MELDDLKQAWQALGRQLERHDAIHLHLLREKKLGQARGRLRPLFWGQIAQIAFGLLLVLLGVACWTQNREAAHLLVCGIVVHVFGVVTIAMAGITLASMAGIDHAAPVLAIQKQLATLRRRYLIGGLVAGLSWWLMWIPATLALAALGGIDLYGNAPAMVWTGLAAGLIGLLGTWWLYRWSHQPVRAQLGRRIDEGAAGGSIRKTQRLIEEIARFEQE